jgi:hypothetical protein
MKNQTATILKIIAILLLLGALSHHSYSYYQILRWFICGLTGYFTYFSYRQNKHAWAWIFGITAVIFNPIAPIYFDRSTWSILDIITAGIIFTSIFKIGGKNKKSRAKKML